MMAWECEAKVSGDRRQRGLKGERVTYLLLNELVRRVEKLEETSDHLVEVGSEESGLLDTVAEVDESSGSVAVDARDGMLEGLKDDGDEFASVEGLEDELGGQRKGCKSSERRQKGGKVRGARREKRATGQGRDSRQSRYRAVRSCGRRRIALEDEGR